MINLVRYSITSATKRANRHSDKDDGTTEQNVELMRLNASAANYHVDRSQSTPDVTLRVLFFYVLSLILYIFDVGSDIGVAYQHYDNGHILSATLITTFVALPLLLLNVMGLVRACRSWREENKKMSVLQGGASLLQIGPVVHLAEPIYYGCRSRWSSRDKEKNYSRMLEVECEVKIFYVLEAFLEAAPQLLVQGYYTGNSLWEYYEHGGNIWPIILQLVSILMSLRSIASSLMAMERVLRLADENKKNMTLWGSALLFFWRFFTITGRCTALVLFAMTFHYWTPFVLLPNYIVTFLVTVAFSFQELDDHACSYMTTVLIAAILLLLAPLKLAKGRSRWLYLTGYLIESTGNAIMLVLCWRYPKVPFTSYICLISLITYIVGIMFMLIYYSLFHPNRCAQNTTSNSGDNAVE